MHNAPVRNLWAFDMATDLLMFVGPIVLASLIIGGVHIFGINVQSDRTVLIQFVLYILFDYSHTYAILFRTYFDREARQIYKPFLVGVPIFVFLLGFGLYAIGLKVFWTFFGYLQTFHFVRQQYGWMRLAERGRALSRWDRNLDTAVVYACTGYPIIYWHTYLLKDFYWYKNMLAPPPIPPVIERIALGAFIVINIVFALRIAWLYLVRRELHIGRFLVYALTFAVWYIGLVRLEVSIISFAAFNTIGHGWPYLVFIYRYVRRNWSPRTAFSRLALSPYGFLPFWLLLIALAYTETYFQYTYQEHNFEMAVLGSFRELPSATLGWLVPLLMIPQATHSVLDGFVWKFRSSRDPNLLFKVRDVG